jgi:hypothetical protein
MNEKQLAKLIAKNAAKAAEAAKKKRGRFQDPTLNATQAPDAEESVGIDRQAFFKEMKRREF